MSPQFTAQVVAPWQRALDEHPLYAAVQNLDDLRVFMAHHVFPVWDFMSLLKSLQQAIAPASVPWRPVGSPELRYFINQIVLGEESDQGPPDAQGRPTFISHFELYTQAMREVGADPGPALRVCELAATRGIEAALAWHEVPAPARDFMRTTFGFVASGQAHRVAAAFALGREQVIPEMFRALLARMGITRELAPAFHYYLERHIALDEGEHAPLALRMVNELVGGDAERLVQAREAAVAAVQARIALWDGTLAALRHHQATKQAANLAVAA
jgi:hypothetical protein